LERSAHIVDHVDRFWDGGKNAGPRCVSVWGMENLFIMLDKDVLESFVGAASRVVEEMLREDQLECGGEI
jgi:hypothetical protein